MNSFARPCLRPVFPSRFICLGLYLLAGLFALAATTEQWPRWRGPLDNGSAESGSYPAKWDATNNVIWKAPLPGKGCSTPIFWNQQIFLTAPVEGRDAVLAYDWNGKSLWQTAFSPERKGAHKNGSGSNPSLTTDGKSLYAFFKSGSLACLDFNGKTLWQTNLLNVFGKDNLYWDFGTSPVLTEQDVVLALLRHGNSWLLAFNKSTGQLHWKVECNYTTAEEGDHSYATPLLIQHQNKEALMVLGGEHLTAYSAVDGKTLWACGDFNPEGRVNWVPVASPLVVGNMAIVPYGRGDRLHGIKLGGSGDVTATHRAWVSKDVGAFVPTPSEYRGRVYVLRDSGGIECIDPLTGQTIWNGKLPKTNSNYYSSPLVADGKIYAAREDGIVYVASINGPLQVLSENDMGERVIASPVALSNRLFIRGEKNLFCFGVKQ